MKLFPGVLNSALLQLMWIYCDVKIESVCLCVTVLLTWAELFNHISHCTTLDLSYLSVTRYLLALWTQLPAAHAIKQRLPTDPRRLLDCAAVLLHQKVFLQYLWRVGGWVCVCAHLYLCVLVCCMCARPALLTRCEDVKGVRYLQPH